MFDLSQVISTLKLKNSELITEKELMRDRCLSSRTSDSNGDRSDSESDTQDRYKELQGNIATFTSQLNSLNNSCDETPPSKDKLPEETQVNGHGTSAFTNGVENKN
jgi:hypothetical protein